MGKLLEPTELGRLTTKLMKDSFPEIIDYGFTAKMEDDLDKIENGQAEYLSVLRDFYTDFEKELKEADEKLDKLEYVKPVEVTDIICDKCGANMVIREGRYGKFAACPNFPKCRNTRRLNDDASAAEGAEEVLADEKCPVCGSDMILKKGAYGSFYACRNYPTAKRPSPIIRIPASPARSAANASSSSRAAAARPSIPARTIPTASSRSGTCRSR